VVREQLEGATPAVVGDLPAWEPQCAENCCQMGTRPGRPVPARGE